MKRKSRGQLLLQSLQPKEPRIDANESKEQDDKDASSQPSQQSQIIASNDNLLDTPILTVDLRHVISSNFKWLEISIARILAKKSLSTWALVKESVESLSGRAFYFEDLIVIIKVYPDAYEVRWEVSSVGNSARTTCELMILVKKSGDLNTFAIDTRLGIFNENLNKFVDLQQLYDNVNVELDLPPKPHVSMDNTGNNAREIARLATIQMNLKKEQVKAELDLYSKRGLIGLEEMATKRGDVRERTKDQREQATQYIENNKRLESLQLVCDILRTQSSIQRKFKRRMSDAMEIVARRLQISQREAKMRIEMLASKLPEFVTINQRDEICSEDIVEVNRYCDYKVIRNSLIYSIDRVE